ncbi:FUSC family protein [Microbacterium sp. C7(2022)]|uniref:FUSC family protein n=1 Tax=Microbacterium sp. C7(2022) TaxID=2992759 RepID=UPI00237AF3CC|nr:FUSC family protein [Microbacterium sp. C7(2022)]MDE0546707.1 FUSC family protein [Microbacterium sp. C7(2022)]
MTTGPMKRVGRGVVHVGPHAGAHWVALRAALSLAVPLLVLWAIGRLDLSMYAAFGAFAALYGRFDAYGDRLRMQLAAGATMLASMLVGTSLSVLDAPAWVRVIGVAVVAAVVSLIAAAWRWHPPGALFAVFAAGASATIPATVHSFVDVLVVGGASALFAVLMTIAIAAFRGGLRGTSPRRLAMDREAFEIAPTVGIGALLAGLTALALIGDHWYWAMVAAVAALGGAHVTARLVRGAQRLVGTLAGVLLAAGLLALDLPPLATIAVAVACQAGAELFIGRNYGIAMVFVTPLALLMVALAVPSDPSVLLIDRVLDTVVGVAIGTLVALLSAALRRPHRGEKS